MQFFDILIYGFGVVISFLYVLYSLVVVGQTTALRKAIITGHGELIQTISIIQLIIAIAVFGASLIYW